MRATTSPWSSRELAAPAGSGTHATSSTRSVRATRFMFEVSAKRLWRASLRVEVRRQDQRWGCYGREFLAWRVDRARGPVLPRDRRAGRRGAAPAACRADQEGHGGGELGVPLARA